MSKPTNPKKVPSQANPQVVPSQANPQVVPSQASSKGAPPQAPQHTPWEQWSDDSFEDTHSQYTHEGELEIQQADVEFNWLEALSYLEIKQNTGRTVVAGCCETTNKYTICNRDGQEIASAKEKGRFFRGVGCGQCCNNRRGFAIVVKSVEYGDSFLCQRWFKPFVSCCPPCMPCTTDTLVVNNIHGEVIADCRNACSFMRPNYGLFDEEGIIRYRVLGPWCRCSCPCMCTNMKFKVVDRNGGIVGKIYKKWGKLVKQLRWDTDIVVIEMSPDIGVKFKAAMVGMSFLLDFMYLADNKTKKQGKPKSLTSLDSH